jgi:hypothetical protein
MKRLKTIFFLILIISSNLSLAFGATNEGYGEDSTALGQFVDTFTSLGNVSTRVEVNRNSTLNSMELNYSTPVTVTSSDVYLKEHKIYSNPAWNPAFTFSIGGNDYVHVASSLASMGRGHIILHANTNWLDNKYVRWRWNGYYSGGSSAVTQFWVMSETSDRTNNTHFPYDDLYDKQLHFTNRVVGGASAFVTTEMQMTNVTGAWTNCSIYWTLADGWSGASVWLRLDWIEINTGAGGSGNLLTINFEDSTNVVMETSGTYYDYGYVNNTGLPYQTGGYELEGWFNTTNYLNDLEVNGTTLVHQTIADIPTGTNMTIEFSPNGTDWYNTLGVVGGNVITDGLNSFELRNLNYSNTYSTRYNLSTTNILLTPRLNQSKLISTIGNSTGGGAPVISGGINSSIILMLIFLCGLGLLLIWGFKR